LALAYPAASTIYLVMDNLNLYSRKSLADVYATGMAGEAWDRFSVHLHLHSRQLAQLTKDRNWIFWRQCLEKSILATLRHCGEKRRSESRLHQDRLEVRLQNCSPRVRLSKKILYAVRHIADD
jgi:hypothetical protein